jgi:hypothetical protein
VTRGYRIDSYDKARVPKTEPNNHNVKYMERKEARKWFLGIIDSGVVGKLASMLIQEVAAHAIV